MPARPPRIVLVGAGSMEFLVNLLRDLWSAPDLGDATVVLHDLDEGRLELAAAVARHVRGRLGAAGRIEATAERRRALAGADFAVCTIRVGGHAASVRDFDVPGRYGIRQTMADTLGAGAIAHALRTIPAMLAIGRDMAELCPDAWLLNYTNPMAMLVWAVYAGTPHRRIAGLCPSLPNTARELAALAGVPFAEVSWLGAGINHQAWVLRLERRGEDLYPRVREAVERDPGGLGRRARVEVFRRLGYFPSESSEHTVESVPWFLTHPQEVARLRVPVGEYLERSTRRLRRVEEVGSALSAGRPLDLGDWPEETTAIVHSVVTGTPRTVYASVRNDGLVTNLPDGCCVEVPCLVDRAGVQPTHVGALPPQPAALNRTFASVCELVVRAALDEEPRLVAHALLADPATAAALPTGRIAALADELAAEVLVT